MAESRDEEGSSGRGPPPNFPWWPSDFMDRFASASLASPEESLNNQESPRNVYQEASSSQKASQVLWSTGMLSEPISNGFYSVIPEKRLKKRFLHIPTLEDLHALGAEGSRADVILVDFKKDKKLSALKHLIMTLVIGLSSNPAAMIKKISGLVGRKTFPFYCTYLIRKGVIAILKALVSNGRVLIFCCLWNSAIRDFLMNHLPNLENLCKCIVNAVSDVYKRPSLESPAKFVLPEISHMFENIVVQMLGHIKHGSCRSRAILFKVLADTVGLESKLMVGVPNDGGVECADSYKHMSVIVTLNSVELLVDLMRFPGKLIPCSTKAFFMTHISAAGESDSAENDSCDSPLEPNSPLYGYSERVDPESAEKEEILQLQRRIEAPSNLSGHSLRNLMIDRTLSISQSEPNIATSFWRRSRSKVVAEQRTASSSPEHPSFRSRGRSLLSGDRKLHRDYTNQVSSSRSDGMSTVEARRLRRRSISITPEIGDDIVRAVRAMNETLKQNRLLRDQGDERSFPYASNDRNSGDVPKDVSRFNFHAAEEMSGGLSPLYDRERMSSQRATSLPSSPLEFRSQTSERSAMETYGRNDELYSTWNKVLESPLFHNRPLLPLQEWNINFSEITVGTRVGIGSFGEVFRGIWNGTDVAVKVFLEQDLTAENMEDFCNEISILSRLRHPNVILFLGACTMPPHLSMVTEYMEMGSLYYLIHLSGQKKKKLSWRRRLKMLRDICRGLMCIHRMKIIHRDLKSANCLVNKHWTVKICDFGLSRVMTESPMQDSSCAGTPEWMAPELIRNEPLNEKCDIFSLGVIMWELCTLNRPWDGVQPERVVYAVANEGSRLEIPEPEGPFGRLIADCWAEPQDRPSCEEILSRLLNCEYTLC